ncbi:MAG: hypothetical protein ACTIJ2_12075 [Sphingobacteriaceae bacterium]
MTLEDRLEKLNRSFGFKENPEDFNFSISPERVVYRNEALRTGNRDLYAGYLADRYPEEMTREMEQYDITAGRLVKLGKEEAIEYFDDNKINLLRSDLHFEDDDAIFSMIIVPQEDISYFLEGHLTDMINGYLTPEESFSKGKSAIFLDKSKVEKKN